MRKSIIAACLALGFLVASCGGKGSGPKPPAPQPTPAPTPAPQPHLLRQIGIGLANGWPAIDPAAYADALASSGQGLAGIEGLPWMDRSGNCDSAHPTLCSNPYPAQRRALFAAMKAKGIVVYVNAANLNSYYSQHMGDATYRELVRGIAADAKATGATVWLSPVSEPWAMPGDRPRALATIARQEWPGVFVLPDLGANHVTGKPFWQGIAFNYLEVHPCTVPDAVTSIRRGPPIFTNTDCGPVVARKAPPLARLSPTDFKTLTAEAVKANAPLNFYDHYSTGTLNMAAVAIIGAEIPGNASPQPTPAPAPGPVTPGAPAISEITFLDDPAVGGWTESSRVTSTSITNPHVVGSGQEGTVCINHSLAGKWPVGGSNDGPVEGNPWVVAKVGGKWFAFTYEFNGVGTVCRSIAFGIWGKYAQYSAVQTWHPQPGELVGLFVSTLARPGVKQTSDERSNIAWRVW